MSEDPVRYSMKPTRIVNTTAPSVPLPPMAPASAAPPEAPAVPPMSPMRISGTALASHSSPAPEPEPLTPGQAQLAADKAKRDKAIADAHGYQDEDGRWRTYRTPDEWKALNRVINEDIKDDKFRDLMGQDYIPRDVLNEPSRRLRIPPAADKRQPWQKRDGHYRG